CLVDCPRSKLATAFGVDVSTVFFFSGAEGWLGRVPQNARFCCRWQGRRFALARARCANGRSDSAPTGLWPLDAELPALGELSEALVPGGARNSWRYSEKEQRSQRRRDAPEFGDGLRVRDTSGEGGPAPARRGARPRLSPRPPPAAAARAPRAHASRARCRTRR